MSEALKFRTFSTPFKESAVLRVEAGEAMLPLARELGIPRKLLYDWHKAWKAHGVTGLNRKRGPKPGSRQVQPSGGPSPQSSVSDLAKAQTRIAELERTIGRQQMDIDFFRKALRALNAPDVQGKLAPASSRSSKP